MEDLVSTEHKVTREAIVQERVKTQEAINAHLTTEVRALRIREESDAATQALLKSLKYPEMNQRYNDLMSSDGATFNRVFVSYKEMNRRDDEGPTASFRRGRKNGQQIDKIDKIWAEFIRWLQTSDPLCCIRGKPGSGKSTLVKFIVDNANTKRLLHLWSPDTIIMSHFFWKIGSPPQNSIKGLLCSLVYQSLKDNRDLVGKVLDRFHHLSPHSYYEDWSTQDLKALLGFILGEGTQHRCIFIDGLDEIGNKDGISNLIDAVGELLTLPNLKLCVSSRPEPLIMNWLQKKQVPGLLLEDLMRPDMEMFVHKELDPFLADDSISKDTHSTLTLDLVSKAQGVFLWLHLATRSITTGIQNKDPDQMLLARLEDLPSELTQLYASMWQNLNQNNPVYRETAARFFFYCLQEGGVIPMFPEVGFPSGFPEAWQPTLFQLACAENTETHDILDGSTATIGREEVLRLCEEARTTILNRCAGLLRVTSPGRNEIIIRAVLDANYLSPPETTSNTTEMENALFGQVIFIHRTAHDFLTDTETGQGILEFGALSHKKLDTRLLKGLLCLLHFLRSEYGVMGRCGSIIHRATALFESSSDEEKQEALETLRTVHRLYENKVIGTDRPSWQPQPPFLSHLTDDAQFDHFVLSTLERSDSSALATDVLREAWDPDLSLYYNRGRAPSPQLIEGLISMGADPHAYDVNWAQQMGSMEPFVRQGTAFSNLLASSVRSIDDGEHLDGNAARDTVKTMLIMAMSCPDLSARTLVIGMINDGDEPSIHNLTWLTRPDTFVRNGRPWILFEVDFRFLLLHTLSRLVTDTTAHGLEGPAMDGLLQGLKNPSAKIRLLITEGEEQNSISCYRLTSELSSSSEVSDIIQHIFPASGDLRGDTQSTSEAKAEGVIYKRLMRLTTDPAAEKVNLESEVTSMAKEKLGFCTLLEAGVIPTPSHLEWVEEYQVHYPLTLKELRIEAEKVASSGAR